MNTTGLKVFFIYTIALTLFVVLSTTSLYIIKSRLIYLNLVRAYTIVEYCLFAWFLFSVYHSALLKKIILYSIFPFCIFCIVDYIYNSGTFNTTPLLVEFLAFIVFIIYFFYEKMKTVVLYPLYQSIVFWICVGLFIYFTGNFFFLLFINSSTDRSFINQMQFIYSLVTITKNILLCVAFLAIERPSEKADEVIFPSELKLDDYFTTNLKNS